MSGGAPLSDQEHLVKAVNHSSYLPLSLLSDLTDANTKSVQGT